MEVRPCIRSRAAGGIGSTNNDVQDVGYTYDAADNVQYRWDYNTRVNTDNE